MNTRKEKIKYLAGLQTGTRSIAELNKNLPAIILSSYDMDPAGREKTIKQVDKLTAAGRVVIHIMYRDQPGNEPINEV